MERKGLIIKAQPTKEQIKSEHLEKFNSLTANWHRSLMAQKLRNGLWTHAITTEDFHIMIRDATNPSTHVALVYSDEEWIQLFVEQGILEMPLKRPINNLLMFSSDESLVSPIVGDIIYFLEGKH